MKKLMISCFLLMICAISLPLQSCNAKNVVRISLSEDASEALKATAKELSEYLSQTYPSSQFDLNPSNTEEQGNIILRASNTAGFVNDEEFRIVGTKKLLVIEGNTDRAVIYGMYALLKNIGWKFYMSFEVPPEQPKPLEFANINFQNAPLKDTRIILNWHNFLSGCTSWDIEEWQAWIDQSRKIGFNTIMVHAYGNNPMQPLRMNGREKKLGYLTTTKKGRDWGAQHVNDVRLIEGGELFESDEFGSKAAKVSEENRSQAAVSLMQDVFRYSKEKSMDICYAIDVDTWIANPQDIIETLPTEALLEIGGYKIANPEHPEGRKYYDAQLHRLFADYPEITHLAAWIRAPKKMTGNGSVWLQYDSNTLPRRWQKEYFAILKKHPELEDEKPYPGIFAISKIFEVYREILDGINPEVELMLGSWNMDYPTRADPFIPKYCGFIPLDYSYKLNEKEVVERLNKVGKERKFYPIVWAHHDDHRYMGRPYKPYGNFNKLLDATSSSGYGVMHWTTHPLDLLFESYERQVWSNSENVSLESTVHDFCEALVNSKEKNLHRYFQQWFTEAPMFGRETSDHFMSSIEPYDLDGYENTLEVVEKAKTRWALLEKTDQSVLNKQGVKEYNYQVGMEQFIISFFNNYHHNQQGNMLLEEGKVKEALAHAKEINPEETLKLYANFVGEYGPTKGEKGIVVSLNLRWLPDCIDLRQRVGLDDIRINFQPTSHDPLSQGEGHYSYFIDSDGGMWKGLGDYEIGQASKAHAVKEATALDDSWIQLSEATKLSVGTIRNHLLKAGVYKVELFKGKGTASSSFQLELSEDGKVIYSKKVTDWNGGYAFEVETTGKEITLQIIPIGKPISLAGIKFSL